MPHLTLEYTHTVKFPTAIPEFVKKLSKCLGSVETFDLNKIQARTRLLDNALMGEDLAAKGFVYAEIKILPTRTEAQINACMERIFEFLKTELESINNHIKLHLSVEIKEFKYYKHQFFN